MSAYCMVIESYNLLLLLLLLLLLKSCTT